MIKYSHRREMGKTTKDLLKKSGAFSVLPIFPQPAGGWQISQTLWQFFYVQKIAIGYCCLHIAPT